LMFSDIRPHLFRPPTPAGSLPHTLAKSCIPAKSYFPRLRSFPLTARALYVKKMACFIIPKEDRSGNSSPEI
jgi:hypothetical protein